MSVMTRPVRLGARLVGPDQPCYVIAEIGVNHGGSLSAAKELVLAAKSAGADCAKFQTFRAERLVTPAATKAAYQERTTGKGESQFDMLKRLELSRDAHRELMEFCAAQHIDFLSTPYGEDDARLLDELGVAAFKIPSALIVEPDFLRAVAAFRKPLILSTGMATLAEVREAFETVRAAGCDIVLLQCTTEYPASSRDVNLRVMETLETMFQVPVGFSDHTTSMSAAVAAVALGAAVIEKHLTLDKTLAGPDHAASADPAEFASLVNAVREVELSLGGSEKEPTAAEQANLVAMRRSVVASRFIHAGDLLDPSMLTSKRPATGIPPKDLHRVVGARALVEIAPDCPLEWWMLERAGDR